MNKLQLNIHVPHRQSVGADTKPPKTDSRRAYICELYKTFGWTIPEGWQQNESPAPQFSEPEATEEAPTVERIKVIKKDK